MPTQARLDRIRQVARHRQQGVVVLEDIHDPHNAAAVLRSCDSFAIQHVVFIFENQRPFDPKRVGKETSSSANKWLDFETFPSTHTALASLKERGYTLAVTTLTDQSQSLYHADLSSPLMALVFGNEHRGVSQTAIEMADIKLRVPMQGMVQSLNLSVTAAICLYEMSRQRQDLGLDRYRLSPEHIEAITQGFETR